MSDSLALPASYAESLKIKARIQSAIDGVRATLAYAFPDIDQRQRDLEVGMELVRAGHRLMDQAQGIPELVPEEFEGLAKGTQP